MNNNTNYSRSLAIKEWAKNSKIILFLRLVVEKAQELWVETRYLADGNRFQEAQKLKTDLQIRVHAIEKGMSIGNLKEGFGNKKACGIIDDLREYVGIGGDIQFIQESCSVLCQYVNFKEEIGQEANDVKTKLNALLEDYHISPLEQGGIFRLRYEEIRERANGTLPEVIASRYAVRDFGNKPIDKETLNKAFKIAEKSPSACNRQSWRIHVYTGAKALKLFKLQGGCNGFASDMQVAILICCDLTSYYLHELNLPYVDGGLYGMNLMLALHHCGLASIPLTMGHKVKSVKKIKREMRIPENEMPVLLIGVGSYKDEFRAAVSYRYPYYQYTSFEE